MGITVNITFSTPLSEEDDNILAGTAYWLMATANRNGQQQQSEDGEQLDDEPRSCGRLDDEGQMCVRRLGHSGRHKYRPFSFTRDMDGPLN